MNYVPIKVKFDAKATKVKFKISYRKGKKSETYLGDGYIGERISNKRL